MSSKNKVLVIGLDGATLHLVKNWAAEGKLPNLAKLMAEGSYGHSQTVPNQNSAPAWSSLMTGKNPGKHGIYHFYEKEGDSYNIRYLNGSDVKGETLWGLLGKAGKKVGVVNVPMTYPARAVNGYLISGMDAPGTESKGFAYPEGLVAELLAVVPDYVVEPGITSFVANKQFNLAVKMAEKSIEARAQAVLYLMEKYPWDFFMVVFREVDVIQHHFWKFMEEGNFKPDGSDHGDYADTILHIYQMLDMELGKLVSRLPSDGYVVVISDHGFGAAEGGPPYINHILKHIGMLKFKDGAVGLKAKLLGGTLSFVQKHTSRKTKERLLRHFPELRNRLDSQKSFSNIDWLKTRAFNEPTRLEVWINVKGRESLGVVTPEAYDGICEDVKKTLYRWHDPLTGKRVVKNVFRKEEVYHGKYLYKAPDMLVIFEDDIRISGVILIDETGAKEYVKCPPDIADALPINGAHRDNGLFMIRGPVIKRGQEFSGVRIVDLAPTILYLMGDNVPSDMDGRVLTDVFIPEMVENKPVLMNGSKTDDSGRSQMQENYSDAERKLIEERLRGLGYIE